VRILHTSDWHLGRDFDRWPLIDDQRAAVDRIVALAVEHEVELVVIAGDLYDKAIPPVEAIRLFEDALADLAATGAVVVAIVGNHDSSVRAAGYDRVTARAGVTVRGDATRITEPVVVDAPRDGGPPVAVYPVPYLEPAVAGPRLARLGDPAASADTAQADDEAPRARHTHGSVMARATELVRADVAARGDVRSVLVAHAFVVGGEVSDSERGLAVGGADQVPDSVFAGFDYVALGHLHRSQHRDEGRIAYSGTPLPYSFSEEGPDKTVRIVDLAPDGSIDVVTVALGVGRKAFTLTGTLEEILAGADGVHAHARDHFVRAVLTDEVRPLQAMGRLQDVYPFAAAVEHRPPARSSDVTAVVEPGGPDGTVTDPFEYVLAFWQDQDGGPPSDTERDLLVAAWSAVDRETDR
jgi:exonuclease SbcD